MTKGKKKEHNPPKQPNPKSKGGSGKYERFQKEVIDKELGFTIFKYAPDVSPNWYVQYNHPQDGQKQPSLRTSNQKEARRKAWKIVTQLRNGTLDKRETPPTKIGDAIDSFLKNKLRIGKREQTITEYRRALGQFQCCMAKLKVYRLDRVTHSDLEKYEDQLRDTGIHVPRTAKSRGAHARPNSDGTVREKIKLVKGLFKWAKRRKLIGENPIEGYELPAYKDPDNYCFTVEEVTKLCEATDPFFAIVFRFLALTGLRQSELFWLTKKDFDVSGKLIHIRPKTFSDTGLKWTPKNDDRKVPLCDDAYDIAVDRLSIPGSRWLFPAPPVPGAKDDRMRACRLWNKLQDAKKAAGIKKGKPHSFRHFFVSQAANSGVSPFRLMKIVGHKELDIILTYYHALDGDLLEAVNQINFGGLTPRK